MKRFRWKNISREGRKMEVLLLSFRVRNVNIEPTNQRQICIEPPGPINKLFLTSDREDSQANQL